MKKSILILAAFAFVAFSCTKTEVKDDTPKKGINFSAYTAKPTKAAPGPQVDVKTDNLEQFEVTAIGNGATYFDNVTFKKISVWESDTKYFWPAFPLTFYAYNTPTKGTFSRDISDIVNSGPKLKFKTSLLLAEQEDLVAAYAKDKIETNNNANGALDITFKHYLTQVIVKAKCSNSNYVVKVDGVKIANMVEEGTYTFSTETMTATGSTKVNYSASFGGKTLPPDANTVEVMTDAGNGRWYLIPQTVTAWDRGDGSDENKMKNSSHGTYLALKVIIKTKDGAQIYPKTGVQTAWMAVPIPTSWASTDPVAPTSIFEQGKKYTIILDFFGNGGAGYVDPQDPGELDGNTGTADNGKPIVGKAIKFNAEVSDWTDVTITIKL